MGFFRIMAGASLLLGSFCTANAEESWPQKLLSESVHSFGDVTRGVNPSYQVIVKNVFKVPMEIVGVRASCGCVTPTIKAQVLQPGAGTVLNLRFNTVGMAGDRASTITISLGGKFRGEAKVATSGRVVETIEVKPEVIDFGRFALSEAGSKKFSGAIINHVDDSWRLTESVVETAKVRVSIHEPKFKGGKIGYPISIRLLGDFEEGEQIVEQVALPTNTESRVVLNIVGRIHSFVEISPRYVTFGKMQPNTEMTKTLVLTGSPGQEFSLVDVESKFKGVEVTSTTKQIVAGEGVMKTLIILVVKLKSPKVMEDVTENTFLLQISLKPKDHRNPTITVTKEVHATFVTTQDASP